MKPGPAREARTSMRTQVERRNKYFLLPIEMETLDGLGPTSQKEGPYDDTCFDITILVFEVDVSPKNSHSLPNS